MAKDSGRVPASIREGMKTKPPKKKKASEAAKKKKKGSKKSDKGRSVKATRMTKGGPKAATKAAQDFDLAVDKIIQKEGYDPDDYPVQISDPINTIHTGLFMLDLILCGGWRKGRMHTIIGRPSCGKSTLIQEGIAAAQRMRKRIWFFDIEESATRQYMIRQGIIADDSYRLPDGSKGFRYLWPDFAEQFYLMLLRMLEKLPLDSDPNTPPKTIIFMDGYESMTSELIMKGKNPIGTFARINSAHQPALRKSLKRHGAVFVATNQLRTSGIGTVFVNPEDEGGGYALKYYSDAKVKLNTSKPKADEGLPTGTLKCKMKTPRNRMADPHKEEKSRLIIGRGFDRLHDRLQFLVKMREVPRGGSYFTLQGKKYQYKKARAMMKDPYYHKLCLHLRSRLSTYESYFKIFDTDEMDWDLREVTT